jgi:hypothetical protein
MGTHADSRSRFERWFVGTPRIRTSVVYLCLGLAWVLLAVTAGPTPSRVIIAAVWIAMALFVGVFALRDRRLGRGFYWRAEPASLVSEEPPAPTTR